MVVSRGFRIVRACFSGPNCTFFRLFRCFTVKQCVLRTAATCHLSEVDKTAIKTGRSTHQNFRATNRASTHERTKIVANALRSVFRATNMHRCRSNAVVRHPGARRGCGASLNALGSVWGGPAYPRSTLGQLWCVSEPSQERPGASLERPRTPRRPQALFCQFSFDYRMIFSRSCPHRSWILRVCDVLSLDDGASR